MNSCWWLNTAWMMSCAAEARAFQRATGDVRRAQERALLNIVRQNKETWFGLRHAFAKIRSAEEFQQAVPTCKYDDLGESVDRIAGGERNVLTQEPVILLEPTGGSSSGEKLIPYTDALRREFQRAIAAWIFDVMWNLPAARRGRAYWSISPLAHGPRRTAGGISIGFEDDRDYLSRWQRSVVSRLFAVSQRIQHLRSLENTRYATLFYLLARRDLTVISIWSPTFLTSLLASLPTHLDAIIDDLRRGSIRLPRPGEEPTPVDLPARRATRRADELQRIFAGSETMADKLASVWPRLVLLSCWTDASSGIHAPQLRELFPRVMLQPKGLLATEGIVSFPLLATGGNVLAVRSHFFEFAEVNGSDAPGNLCLAHELEPNRNYRLLLTTGGGLYRYDLGDEIQVVGHYHECPLIRFVGRRDSITDLVGEKLHERHVQTAIEAVCQELNTAAGFALLAPTSDAPLGYRLYFLGKSHHDTNSARQLAVRLEAQLATNPQYRFAVASGQLQPVDVRFVDQDAWRRYQEVCVQRGQKLGDVKPAVLDQWNGWETVFTTDNAATVSAASSGTGGD